MSVALGDAAYYAFIVGDDGEQIELTNYIDSLQWSELQGQLSMKATFSARNEKTDEGYISDICKPGAFLVVVAKTSKGMQEVFRGSIEVWNTSLNADSDTVKITAYDELYPTQKSQDNMVVKNKTLPAKAIKKVFKTWKIKMGIYDGPTVKPPKLIFQARSVADIINTILNEAYLKGDERCFMRSNNGTVDIIHYYDNYDIYYFNGDNCTQVDEKQSTENLITRIKIMDKEGTKKKATIDGYTDYGIRQEIMQMQEGVSLKDTKVKAEMELDEKGQIEKSTTINCPDLPFLRKGDVVYTNIGASVGYYDVLGVTHTANGATMTLNLAYSDLNPSEDNLSPWRQRKPVKGDLVTFKGGTYHMTQKANSKEFPANRGLAKVTSVKKVTKKNANKILYPYKLVHTNSQSTINGWVSEDQFFLGR